MNRFPVVLLVVVVLLMFLSTAALGQLQNLPPHLRRAASNPEQEAYRQIQIQRTLEAQQRTAMRRVEQEARASAAINEVMPSVSAAELKRIEKLLTPHPDDLKQHKAFLELDRTGIFKLFPQSACDDFRVVRVDGECANSVPSGSRYSFRAGANTPDIHYLNDKLYVKGFFALLMLGNVGDVPIESLSPTERHLKPLLEFVPGADFDTARSQTSDIEEGLLLGGTKYTDRSEIVLGQTYLLRIVAYKNSNNLQRRLTRASITKDDPIYGFERLQTDHRMDLTLAFRIIRKDENGVLTLIWRELARKKPPVITFGENEGMSDFNF